MYCINCGNPLRDGAKFCSKCGRPALQSSYRGPAQKEESIVRPIVIDHGRYQTSVNNNLPPVSRKRKPSNHVVVLVATLFIAAGIIAGIIIVSNSISNSRSDNSYYEEANSSFSIEGKWKNVGDTTFGNVSKGGIVLFDGNHCNYSSPQDTYVFYSEGSEYKLDCTGLLGHAFSFRVEVLDNDHIEIYHGSHMVELARIDG